MRADGLTECPDGRNWLAVAGNGEGLCNPPERSGHPHAVPFLCFYTTQILVATGIDPDGNSCQGWFTGKCNCRGWPEAGSGFQ